MAGNRKGSVPLWCPRRKRVHSVRPAHGVEVIGQVIRCPVCREDHVAESPGRSVLRRAEARRGRWGRFGLTFPLVLLATAGGVGAVLWFMGNRSDSGASSELPDSQPMRGRVKSVLVSNDGTPLNVTNVTFFVADSGNVYHLSFAEDCAVSGGSPTVPDGHGNPTRIGGNWFLLHSEGLYEVSGERDPEGKKLSTRDSTPLRITVFEVVRQGAGESRVDMGWWTDDGVRVDSGGGMALSVVGGKLQIAGGVIEVGRTARWAK